MGRENKIKKFLAYLQIFLAVSLSFVFAFSFNSGNVYAQAQQVCCETDNSGNICSYVDASQCTNANVQKAATSCDQTSFCGAGVCVGLDGFCYDNYPRALCENRGGSFVSNARSEDVSQCSFGCCVIGTQAEFVTRDRCIEATGQFPDLEVDFREDVASEFECLNLARNQVQGCCARSDGVCSYGAKSECDLQPSVSGEGFYEGVFCSDSSLRDVCECAPHPDPNIDRQAALRATTCLADRDEVYWADSCGNPEGVVTERIFSGVPNSARTEGICDYNDGTICADSDDDGIATCESLDCSANEFLSFGLENYRGTSNSEIENGGGVLNGESWCQFDSSRQEQRFDEFSTADRRGRDPVGSRYYRSICINGQELIEPCKDFREEYCYSNTVEVESANRVYTEAKCIENEWEVCTVECNTADPFTMSKEEFEESLRKDQQCCLSSNRDCSWAGSKCVPAVSPGFKYWEGEGADVCGRASLECSAVFVCGGWNRLFGCDNEGTAGVVTGGAAGLGAGGYTALALGTLGWPAFIGGAGAAALVGFSAGQSGWKVVSGGECLSQEFLQAANNLCRSYGDCGADFNYLDDFSIPGNIDNKFTYSRAGFSNTEQINEEIAGAVREDLEEKLGYNFGDNVPGNLSDFADWEQGSDFFDFRRPTERPEGGILGKGKRVLFTEDDIAGGFLSPGALAGGSLVAGMIAGAATGYGPLVSVGLSASPLGYLVGQALQHTGIEAFKTLSIGGVRGSLTTEYINTFHNAFDGATSTVSDRFVTQAIISPESDFVIVEGFSEEFKSELLKRGLDGQAVSQVERELIGKSPGVDITSQTFDNALDKAAENYAQRKVQSGFSAYMTGVSAALWAYTIFQLGDVIFEDVKTVPVKTTCQPWQAPTYRTRATDTDVCELCNPDFEDYVDENKNPLDARALKRCSEYRCKSLGASCELLNVGSGEELCVSLNKLDTNSPKINPWIEGFTLDPNEFEVSENTDKTGFRIKDKNTANGIGIPIYTPFFLAIQTDEPSQCKMSLEHSNRYESMPNNFFGGNVFKYFHVNNMVYPATAGVNETAGVLLQGGGDYRLNLRCTDAVGNANEADYVIEFTVSPEDDLTPPQIVGSSITPLESVLGSQIQFGREVYLTHGATSTDVTLFVNEPAECKYSFNPIDYSLMDESNRCNVVGGEPTAPPYYECEFADPGGILGRGPSISGFNSTAELRQFVYFKCKDKSGNFNRDAYSITLRGSEPLEITSSGPGGLIKTSTAIVNVTLQVNTEGGALLNGDSVCKYTTEENLKENLGSMSEFLRTNSSLHTQPWQPSSGIQRFFIGCYDMAGNVDYGEINFEVEQDVTPPFITKVYRDENFQPPQFTVEINEPGQCKDGVDGVFEYETGGNLMNVVNVNSTVFSSTVSNSDVYYVVCKDDFGNVMGPATIQIAVV